MSDSDASQAATQVRTGMHPVFRRLGKILLFVAFVVLLLALLAWRMWQIRGTVAQLEWDTAQTEGAPPGSVTATWLGVSTLLFDDGETQILIDGAFTRVNALSALLLPVSSDIATINYALATYRMNRLAAIIPAHSHYDHAMDVGHVANRGSAVVLGSESTANIALGAAVPVNQYQILASGETRQFGDFTIKLIASVHAPVGLNGEEIFPGDISEPLRQPARISAYRTGVAWSIVLAHPRGTTLVQGSAGYVEDLLHDEPVDVVMLSVAGLAALGRDYTEDYWQETVLATGARRVIAIHYDDFTAPFGTVRLLPDLLDKVVVAAAWLNELNAENPATNAIERAPFGQAIALY